MSEKSGITIADLLSPRLDRMEETTKAELTKNEEVKNKQLSWGVIGDEAGAAIRTVLDYDLFEVVAHAWSVARELHEYTDKTKHPDGERSVVHLGDHNFTVTLHPILSVSVGPIECPPLQFTLDLKAHFKSVALSITNGYITAAAPGEVFASAQLKYGNVDLHKRKDSAKLKLPGRLDFGSPGVRIV